MVIASLLFTLLEGSRYMMLGMMAVISSQSVTESVFAEYNIPAYQNYHLFMMDSSYGTGELMLSKVQARMQELGQENLNPSISGYGKYSNFLQMDVTDSSVIQYELASDNHAAPLLKQIAQLMKKEAAVDIVRKVTDVQESDKQGKKADQYLDGALDKISEAKEAAEEASKKTEGLKAEGMKAGAEASKKAERMKAKEVRKTGDFCICADNVQKTSQGILQIQNGQKDLPGTFENNTSDQDIFTIKVSRQDVPESGISDREISDQDIENPMEDVKSAKSSPLLGQIISGGNGISAKQTVKEDSVEKRTLNTGNYEDDSSSGIIDKMLIIQYLKKYTSNYRNSVSVPHELAYEQEYILFGKYTDEDNLEKMASRLLLLREGINFAYLLTDQAKCDEAMAMAAVIAAAAGIPGAVKAIQMGLLASWAYSESIAELRTLFSGGKIAAVKSSENWTVSLSQVASVLFDHSIRSREVNRGLDYEDFLDSFLVIESLNKIGIRFANLLEKNIRLYSGYEQIKLDCMITAMETDCTYQARQMFLSFVSIVQLSGEGYQYKEKYAFSYTGKDK